MKFEGGIYPVKTAYRWGFDFTVGDGHELRGFTSDSAAFGLAARCLDFSSGRGVVANVNSSQELPAFGQFGQG